MLNALNQSIDDATAPESLDEVIGIEASAFGSKFTYTKSWEGLKKDPRFPKLQFPELGRANLNAQKAKIWRVFENEIVDGPEYYIGVCWPEDAEPFIFRAFYELPFTLD